jgi:hypothetical protein
VVSTRVKEVAIGLITDDQVAERRPLSDLDTQHTVNRRGRRANEAIWLCQFYYNPKSGGTIPSVRETPAAAIWCRAVNRRAGPRGKWGPTKWAGPGRVSPVSDRFGATMWKPGSLIGAGGRPVCRYVDRADRRIISDRTK